MKQNRPALETENEILTQCAQAVRLAITADFHWRQASAFARALRRCSCVGGGWKQFLVFSLTSWYVGQSDSEGLLVPQSAVETPWGRIDCWLVGPAYRHLLAHGRMSQLFCAFEHCVFDLDIQEISS